VPVDVFPPATVVGLRLNEVKLNGPMFRVAFFDVVPSVPVIVADIELATTEVVTEKVAEVAPA
jgi:hypothetical protein